MWHTGQAPVVPGPRVESGKHQQGVVDFLRCLWAGLRGGTYCWRKGKGSQNSQLFAMQSACQSWLLLPTNPLNPGEGTGGHWAGGGGPWKAARKG